MSKTRLLLIPALLAVGFSATFAYASTIYFSNTYGNGGWSQVGSSVSVDSIFFPGVVKFNNSIGGGGVDQNRVVHHISSTLPSTWTANFDYKFSSSNIPNHRIFALTSTSDDPEIQLPPNRIIVNHGQGIDALFVTTSGGVDTTPIPISPNVQYYVKLEKTPTQLKLSVFSDSSRTVNIPGSPVTLAISSSDFSNLNYLQHEGCTNCGSARTLTAKLDNTRIFVTGTSQTLFSDSYSDPTWTQIGTSVTVNGLTSGSGVFFDNTAGGGGVTQNRVLKHISTPLPLTGWIADFDYKFTASSIPDAYPLALTSSTVDPETQAAGFNAILVFHGDNSDVMHLSIHRGLIRTDMPSLYTGIPILPNTKYYVQLARTPTLLTLSIFSDSSRTIQIPGSPITIPINSTDFANLSYVQHSGSLASGPARTLTAKIDNIQIFSPSPAQCIAPPSNLVGWWPADGNTNDLIGSHTGTISGGVTFAPGKVSQAFSFDGTGSVNVGSLGIDSDTKPFSEIAWINPSTSAINDGLPHTIIAEGSTPNNSGNGEFMTHLSLVGSSGLGKLEVEIGATQTYSTIKDTSPIIQPGKWSLVAVTYDGSRTAAGIKVYVNGVEQTTTATPASGFTGTAIPRDQWAIGSQAVNVYNPFGGLIDETEIFNTAITQQVIQSEFTADSAGKCKPIVQVGNSPTGIGVNIQTNKIYVANQNDNTLSVVDLNTNNVIKTISVGARPLGVDVNMKTNKIYVANFNSGTVSVIDGITDTVVASTKVGDDPVGVGVNPTTNKIYVGNYNTGTVSVIDGTSNNVVNTITVESGTSGIGVNTLTNKVYAVNAQPSKIAGTVSVIDGSSDIVLSTIVVGKNPQWSQVNPTTNKIYVTNQGSNTISIIDGANNSVSSTISVTAGPGGLGLNSVTNKIYYPTTAGTIKVLDGNTNAITMTLPVGGSPDYIGINANANKIYVSDISSNILVILNSS